jgi:hypothetical protein
MTASPAFDCERREAGTVSRTATSWRHVSVYERTMHDGATLGAIQLNHDV